MKGSDFKSEPFLMEVLYFELRKNMINVKIVEIAGINMPAISTIHPNDFHYLGLFHLE